MGYVMVDVESDGPIPGDYSMICFGAVLVTDALDQTFYGPPQSDFRQVDSGRSRRQRLRAGGDLGVRRARRGDGEVRAVASEHTGARPFFISDNNGFDWQFINWYFWHFVGRNPFGHSSANLGSLYKGMVRDTFKNFKHLRRTSHTHPPVDDARGNAEALLEMKKDGLKIAL